MNLQTKDFLNHTIIILADILPSSDEDKIPLEKGMQEWESSESVEYLRKICSQLSKESKVFTNLLDFLSWITSLTLTERESLIVWNLIEGLASRSREGYVPAILESIGVACIGSDAYSQNLTLDKYIFKKSISSNLAGRFGLGIPEMGDSNDSYSDLSPQESIFIKPRFDGSSLGIDGMNHISSVTDYQSFMDKVRSSPYLSGLHPKTDWIWEEYLPGDEFTVCLMQTENGWLGEAGQVWSPETVYSESVKTKSSMPEKIFPIENREIKVFMTSESIRIAEDMEWEGYARLDWKLNRRGEPILLEANLTPGLSPFYSLYPLVWEKIGKIGYNELIYRILTIGWKNFQEKKRYQYGRYYQSRFYKPS